MHAPNTAQTNETSPNTAATSPVTDRRPFRPTAPTRASRLPSLRSKGSHRGSLVAGPVRTRLVYESKLESDIAHALLARPDVVDLFDQPPAVAYVGQDGKRHSHTFDFLAAMADGRRIAIAVKPKHRAEAVRLRALLKVIARQMPREFATHVVLLTECSHSRDAVRNARLIHAARREPAGFSDDAVMAAIAGIRGTVTVAAVVEATGLRGAAFRAVVRRITAGDITVAGKERITHATRISASALVEAA